VNRNEWSGFTLRSEGRVRGKLEAVEGLRGDRGRAPKDERNGGSKSVLDPPHRCILRNRATRERFTDRVQHGFSRNEWPPENHHGENQIQKRKRVARPNSHQRKRVEPSAPPGKRVVLIRTLSITCARRESRRSARKNDAEARREMQESERRFDRSWPSGFGRQEGASKARREEERARMSASQKRRKGSWAVSLLRPHVCWMFLCPSHRGS
jgi:hypothetical protein